MTDAKHTPWVKFRYLVRMAYDAGAVSGQPANSGALDTLARNLAALFPEFAATADLREACHEALALLSENDFPDSEAEKCADAVRAELNIAIAKAEGE